MRLAQELEQVSDGAIVPRMIVWKLRTLCQAHGFAVVDQAMSWLFWYGHDHLPGSGAENWGAVFNTSLEDVIQAYVAARDERAAEIGSDAAGFDLYAWLSDQEEAQNRAECEAEEREAQAREAARQRAEAERQAAARQEGEAKAWRREREDAERAHREEYPDHYEACGRCRRCRSGAPCFSLVHRGDGDPWCGESLSYETEAA